jgi:four helix bundle protein
LSKQKKWRKRRIGKKHLGSGPKFASGVIGFYCELPKNRMECQVLGKQLLRSGTSVAANYREASKARSNAEFVSKIEICIQWAGLCGGSN